MSKLTIIGVAADRSGSMHSIIDDARGGLNAFIADQQRQPGDASFTLVLFDHEYLILHDGTPMARVEPINEKTYVPRGNTALLDAIGRLMNSIKARTVDMQEGTYEVHIVILTDGLENASHEFTYDMTAKLIEDQQKTGWNFTFLGANQEVIKQASRLRIDPSRAQDFGGSGQGLRDSLGVTSVSISRSRGGHSSSGGGVVH